MGGVTGRTEACAEDIQQAVRERGVISTINVKTLRFIFHCVSSFPFIWGRRFVLGYDIAILCTHLYLIGRRQAAIREEKKSQKSEVGYVQDLARNIARFHKTHSRHLLFRHSDIGSGAPDIMSTEGLEREPYSYSNICLQRQLAT